MSLKDLLTKHEFKFKKKYGQNFITDPGLLKKIVMTAEITPEDIIVEIGPGAGTLTKVLAEKAGKVIAIEIDEDLIPVLEESLADKNNVEVVLGDALQVDLDRLVFDYTGSNKSYKVVANLPYYITSPLIMYLLESRFRIERMVIMVQKEVAERIQALPGTKDYGALTVSVNLYCEPRLAFNVPRHLFTPQPEVDSAVVDLKVRKKLDFKINDEGLLKRVIKAAFNQRRKTLVNSLKVLGVEKEKLMSVLDHCAINPQRRGETLSLEEFIKLANELSQI